MTDGDRLRMHHDGAMELGFAPSFHPYSPAPPRKAFQPVVVNWSSTREAEQNRIRQIATAPPDLQETCPFLTHYALNWMTVLGLQNPSLFSQRIHLAAVTRFTQPEFTTLHFLIRKA